MDTNQGCRGYRSENGYRSGTQYRDLSSTYMYIMHIFNVFTIVVYTNGVPSGAILFGKCLHREISSKYKIKNKNRS